MSRCIPPCVRWMKPVERKMLIKNRPTPTRITICKLPFPPIIMSLHLIIIILGLLAIKTVIERKPRRLRAILFGIPPLIVAVLVVFSIYAPIQFLYWIARSGGGLAEVRDSGYYLIYRTVRQELTPTEYVFQRALFLRMISSCWMCGSGFLFVFFRWVEPAIPDRENELTNP